MPRRPSIRRPILGGLAAAALVLASCGDDDAVDTATDDTAVTDTDDGAPSSGDATDDGDAATGACELLPESQVSSALGDPAEVVHEEGSGASLEMCEWRFEAAEDAIGIPPTLQLVLLGSDDYEARTRGGDDLYEDVPGLGDEAKWTFAGSEETGYMAQLLVLDGDEGIHLNAAGFEFTGEDEAREMFVSFAEEALGAG